MLCWHPTVFSPTTGCGLILQEMAHRVMTLLSLSLRLRMPKPAGRSTWAEYLQVGFRQVDQWHGCWHAKRVIDWLGWSALQERCDVRIPRIVRGLWVFRSCKSMALATGKFPSRDAGYATGIKAACGTRSSRRVKQMGVVLIRILLPPMKIFALEFGTYPAQELRCDWTYMTVVMACQRDGLRVRDAFWKEVVCMNE